MNDASALVIYRFALAAAMGGAFSFTAALWQFPLVAAGGFAVGLVMALLLHQIHQRIEQPLMETGADASDAVCGVSSCRVDPAPPGCWRWCRCGIVLSRHSPHLFSSQTRLMAVAFWNFLTFMLNGLVCILIGLQLPAILRAAACVGACGGWLCGDDLRGAGGAADRLDISRGRICRG